MKLAHCVFPFATMYADSYCRVAYETGVSPIRAMLLEFPRDESLYIASNASNYEVGGSPFVNLRVVVLWLHCMHVVCRW